METPSLLRPLEAIGDATYSPRQLARLLKVPVRQLARWQRLGLFPRRRSYGWQDLVRGRKLCQCDQARISPARLRHSLAALRARAPEMGDPVLDAGFALFANRVEVRFQGQSMDALSGQFRLPFDSPAARPGCLPLDAAARNAAPAAARDAEQWFAYALALESDPETRAAAAAAYQRCLDLDAGFASAHINLGTLHYHQKDFPAAESCYRAAIALDPDYALAHFNLGNVLDETGRLELAIEAYAAAVRLSPGYADAHYNLALAYQRQGYHRRAVPHWRSYLGLDRQSPWANHARQQLKQTLARDPLQMV